MIFPVQFGINRHLQIFQRPQSALALRARALWLLHFLVEKFTRPNCTGNHVITYTNKPE